MTKNSKLCEFIYTNKDTWREMIAELGIIVKDDGPLSLFMYSVKSDFFNPIVRESRGIIINTETCDVVCFPFKKFGRDDQSFTEEIDWSTAKVSMKMDGCIVKLWFNKLTNSWQFSSNSCINAKDALFSSDSDLTILDLIKMSYQYNLLNSELEKGKFNKNYTYIFELCSPYILNVVHYNETKLYHIGTRDNISCKEIDVSCCIEKPIQYNFKSYEECRCFCDMILNQSGAECPNKGNIKYCDVEGLVVCDSKYRRMKIKAPIYTVLHNIVTGDDKIVIMLLQMIENKSLDIFSIIEYHPEVSHIILYYAYRYYHVMRDLTALVNICRDIYPKIGYDRKLLASKISKIEYSNIAFMSLDNEYSVDELLHKTRFGKYKTLLKYVKTYEPNNFGYLYKGLLCNKEHDEYKGDKIC